MFLTGSIRPILRKIKVHDPELMVLNCIYLSVAAFLSVNSCFHGKIKREVQILSASLQLEN